MLKFANTKMATTLRQLGVSFEIPDEHNSQVLTTGETYMMDVHVEQWTEKDSRGARHMVAISSYGQQNGDAMADPDILCEVIIDGDWKTGTIYLRPYHYQNDYLGIFQEFWVFKDDKVLVNAKGITSLCSFLNDWAYSIKASGYKLKVKEEKP